MERNHLRPPNNNYNETIYLQIAKPNPKSIQTQRLTKTKRSYDIFCSPLVSTNNDDAVTFSKI